MSFLVHPFAVTTVILEVKTLPLVSRSNRREGSRKRGVNETDNRLGCIICDRY